jgi:hypothetical protein
MKLILTNQKLPTNLYLETIGNDKLTFNWGLPALTNQIIFLSFPEHPTYTSLVEP